MLSLLFKALTLSEAAGDVDAQCTAMANLNNLFEEATISQGGGKPADETADEQFSSPLKEAPSQNKGRSYRDRIRQLQKSLGREINTTCPVCLDDIDGQNEVSLDSMAPICVLKCLHVLHISCHKRSQRDICPLCMK